MRGSVVCGILGGLLVVSTTIYHFAIPENLRGGGGAATEKVAHDSRHWGANDAEFDWCEPDYVAHPWVAEMWNTLTSLLYIVPAVVVAVLQPCKVWSAEGFRLVLMVLIGVGSVMFHASLRYISQLADEVPMHWLAVAAAHALYFRNCKGGGPRWVVHLLVIIEVLLPALLLSTPRDPPEAAALHQTVRGCMALSYSICFIYIFVASSAAAKEVDAVVSKSKGKPSSTGERLFDAAFLIFVFAILCWLTDICACPALMALPYGIPYPQLHALGWHLGTAIGLYLLHTLVAYHHRALCKRHEVRVRWKGCIPYVALPYRT